MRNIKLLFGALLIASRALSQVDDAALTTQANVIRNETTAGGNTKARIANMYQSIIDSKVSILSPRLTLSSTLNYVWTATGTTGLGSWQPVVGGVASVFGRTGAITAQTDDYSISQITNGLSNSLSAGHLYVGNVSNLAASVAASGDVSLSSSGVFSVDKVSGLSWPTISGQSGKYLTNNGSTLSWASISATLAGLTDVNISSPSNNQFFHYQTSDSKWHNFTFAAGTDYEVPLTFSTGLTRSTNTITVNTSQNINTLSNLTSNGLVKTSGGTGALSIATSGTDYAPPTSGSSILKGNGSGGFSNAVSNTDYQAVITFGTNVLAALGINVGSAGAFTTFNGAGGTPSSMVGTNITGIPPTTGISGWPSNSSGVLTNNGSGTLTWAAAAGGNPFADNTDLFKNSSDATKIIRFSLGGLTTATTRTWTFPDVNGTFARSDAAQTFIGVQTFGSLPVFSVPLTTLGTIATGIWQGTKIGLAYGGTNADLSATGGANQFLKQSSSGAAITVGTLVSGDVPNNAANTSGSAGSVTNSLSIAAELISGGASSFNGSAAKSIAIQAGSVTNTMLAGSIDVTSKLTGAVPIANGGTNNGSLSVTQGNVYYGDGTKLVALSPGTAGQYMQTQGASANPVWANAASVARDAMGDANYTWVAGKTIVGINATFTAARQLTLPAANSVTAGTTIQIIDEVATLTPTNYLTIARASSDVINGLTSIKVTGAYAAVSLTSDGTSKWTARTSTDLYQLVTISSNTYTLDFQNNYKEVIFDPSSTAATANFTVALSNDTYAKKFQFYVKLNGTNLTMTCPSSFTCLTGDTNWSGSGSHIYTFNGVMSNLQYLVVCEWNVATSKWRMTVSSSDFN